MVFKKKGFPDIEELVLCSVKRIEPHSAFVDIDEYVNVEGMIHISEVASRGVRDIRDYLSVGKKIVCKVLSNKAGEIDVSLKRVNSGARKQKLNESRTENRFYHLVEHAAFQAGKPDSGIKIIDSLINKYGSLLSAFEALKSEGLKFLDGVSLPEGVNDLIKDSFESLLKQLSVCIKRTVALSSNEGDGIVRIKKLLGSVNFPKSIISVDFSYIGSGKFVLSIEASSYKLAEDFFVELCEKLESEGRSLGVMVSF